MTDLNKAVADVILPLVREDIEGRVKGIMADMESKVAEIAAKVADAKPRVSHVDGEDRVTLTITRGSHANGAERHAGTWRLNAKGNLMLVREDS